MFLANSPVITFKHPSKDALPSLESNVRVQEPKDQDAELVTEPRCQSTVSLPNFGCLWSGEGWGTEETSRWEAGPC